MCPVTNTIRAIEGERVKANYLRTATEQRRMATEVARVEIERQKAEVCSRCENRIGQQVLAVTLKVLHDEYGFGAKRLETVRQGVENLFFLCGESDRFKATDCIEWLKCIGIDIESE